MNGDFEWDRVLLALGFLTAMFIYPVIVLWRAERKKREDG